MDHAITIGNVLLASGVALGIILAIAFVVALLAGPFMFWDGH